MLAISQEPLPLTSRSTSRRTYKPQLHRHGTPGYYPELGDCWRTCVANLLGFDPEDVPHFYMINRSTDSLEGLKLTQYWLSSQFGLQLSQYLLVAPRLDLGLFVDWQEQWLTDMLTITAVNTLGRNGHAILTRNGSLEHDPAQPEGHPGYGMFLFGPIDVLETDFSNAYISYTITEMENKDATWTVPSYISRIDSGEV